MYLQTKALVLRVTDYNDKDALLTLLTPQDGKLTVKARGLRRKNSPLTAPCQLLSYGDFTLFSYRDMYTINEASSLELFQPLRRDLTKLSLGTYFAQVADLLSQEDLPQPELLSLVLNCLHMLCREDISQEKIKAVFELRAACIAGFTPDLSCCHVCGSTQAVCIHISGGVLECAKCRQWDDAGIRLPVAPGTLAAMRYLTACPPGDIFRFTLGQEDLTQLSQVTEAYLCAQLERGFSTLDFYKSLFI